MKTLSVKQPWAHLLCTGIKNIENRTWKLPEKYIGKRVLIHAGKTIDYNAVNKIANFNGALSQLLQNGVYKNEFPLGSIIGSVRFVDCTFNHHSIWAEKSEGIATGGHVINVNKPIIWNWVVADPVLFDRPILNVKGKLNFWNYEMDSIVEFINN